MPPGFRWTLDELEIHRLEGPPPARFDCGRDEQNEFLHRHALADQEQFLSATYLFHLDGLPAAYATVCMDAIPLAKDERAPGVRFGHVGALKLAQLGVHTSFQDRGLGSHAVFFAIELASNLAEAAGCRYVTVDAKPDLTSWYGRLGFLRNRLHQEERIKQAVAHRRDPEKISVSMRYDLNEAP